MLNIPRAKNEESTRPVKWSCGGLPRVEHDRGQSRGHAFRSAKKEEPVENGTHWFDEAVMEAEIMNFRWHGLRQTCTSRSRMEGAPPADVEDLLGATVWRRQDGARISVWSNCGRWYSCLGHVTPRVTRTKTLCPWLSCKLVCI